MFTSLIWLINIDLKDAYFTIPIYNADQKYLRFPWEGKIYQFLCLAFEMTVASWVFTKLMNDQISYLRRLGLRMVIYLRHTSFEQDKERCSVRLHKSERFWKVWGS